MRVTVPALAILILTGAANAQDLTIVSKHVTSDGRTETMTSYITADRVRAAQSDSSEMMFDLKSGDLTVFDAKKKQYYVITQKDVDDMSAMIKERMNSPEMKRAMDQMKSLPPDQQKKMQEMMGGMFAVSVEKAGTSRTIAGYKCDNWIVTIGQISRSEQCLSTDLKLPDTAWAGYRRFGDMMKSFTAAMGPMANSFDKMREQMEKMKGFPLASSSTSSIMGREMKTTTEVTSISRGPIPASAWAIPAGYTKVENPMMASLAKKR
jgi:hypothetical protein